MMRKLFACISIVALSATLPSLAAPGDSGSDDAAALTKVATPDTSAAALESVSNASNELKQVVDKVYPAFVLFMNEGGSGVCVSPDGYLLTNHHVASRATARYESGGRNADELLLEVYMPGNTKPFIAEPVGADPRGDIVMMKLRLDEGQTVPYVDIGSSDDVQVGDITISVGNPFLLSGVAFEPSVSAGIVTATGRFQGGYSDCIQVDTPINPGNSGGPSFNLAGKLIGINGRILTRHRLRYNTGAGYAISAAQLKRFIPVFKSNPGGAIIVRHGLISGLAMRHRGQTADGAEVLDVRQQSTAWQAGFRAGDVITHVGPYRVHSTIKYYGKLQTWPQNSVVEFTVQRGDETMKMRAKLDVPVEANQGASLPLAKESNGGADFEDDFIYQDTPPSSRSAGMSFFPVRERPSGKLSLQLKPWFDDFGNPQGWVVEGMTQEASRGGFLSNAKEVLEVNDLLTHINGRPILYAADILDSLGGFRPGDEIELTVIRDEEEFTTPLTLGFHD